MADDLELDVIDDSQDTDKGEEKFTGTQRQNSDQAVVRASPQALKYELGFLCKCVKIDVNTCMSHITPLYFAKKRLERQDIRGSTFTKQFNLPGIHFVTGIKTSFS